MVKYLSFSNDTVLSLMDLTTMGGSSKKDDDSKIGQFSTGLKYAISILLREGINFYIYTDSQDSDFDRKVYTFFTKSTTIDGKTKDLIYVREECENLGDEKLDVCNEYQTAFSPDLGYQWELWQAIREIYSNCLDEDGVVDFNDPFISFSNGTKIRIEIDDKIQKIIDNWNRYFLSEELSPLGDDPGVQVDKSCKIKVLRIPEGEKKILRIFKQGFLVYEEDIYSTFWYNIYQGELDEKRQLLEPYSVCNSIRWDILRHSEEDVIKEFIQEGKFDEGFEESYDFDCSYDNFKEVIQELNDSGELEKLKLPEAKKRQLGEVRGLNLGFKSLKADLDSPWYHSGVFVEEVKEKKEEHLSLEDKILNKIKSYNLEISDEITVKSSKIKTYKVLVDISNKEFFVSESFNFEEDNWQLLKACFKYKFNDSQNEIFKYLANEMYK